MELNKDFMDIDITSDLELKKSDFLSLDISEINTTTKKDNVTVTDFNLGLKTDYITRKDLDKLFI